MSQTETLNAANVIGDGGLTHPRQRRKVVNAFWQPFVQFKLLLYMLGSTAVVAVLLGAFLYVAFSDLIAVVGNTSDGTDYYTDTIGYQFANMMRYCAALFVLYILLLATVCVAYTHRLMGPMRPFIRHVNALAKGDYDSRVHLRKGDLDLHMEFADSLNDLADHMQNAKAQSAGSEEEKPR